MRTLPEVRRRIHSYLGLSEEAIRQHSLALYRSSEMAELGLRPGPPHRGLSEATVADPANVGMLILAAIIDGERATLGRRTAQLWQASYEGSGKACKVTKAQTLGGTLTGLLENPLKIELLDFIEYVLGVEAVTLSWKDPARWRVSLFHTYGKQWEEFRQTWLAAGRLTVRKQLPGTTLRKIADIIATDGGIAP